MKFFPILLAYYKRNYSVIPELILKTAVKSDVTAVVCGLLDIIGSISLCCKIKLIALVCKLGNPRNVHLFKRSYDSFHLKRLKVLAVILEALLKLCPLPVCHVHLISFPIILRNGCCLKKSRVIENSNIVLGCINLRRIHLRNLSRNNRSLSRIVIHKDK